MTYATIIKKETGEFKRKIGPFENANAARTGCSKEANETLVWTRAENSWEAHSQHDIFQVPLDQPQGLQK